jgi:hypothetical protein
MKPFLMALALVATAAAAQEPLPPCPAAEDVMPKQLLGTWKAEMQGEWDTALVTLVPHPDYVQSFRGTVDRGGKRSQLAGDLDDEGFTLEESADGTHIAATWLGDVVDGSCGREIRGTWTKDGETSGKAFILRKQ